MPVVIPNGRRCAQPRRHRPFPQAQDLSGYSVVVFASLAAAIGAFFIEQRGAQATDEQL